MLPWKMPAGQYTVIMTEHGTSYDISTHYLNDRGELIYATVDEDLTYTQYKRIRAKLGRPSMILSGSCLAWYIHV